MADWQIAPGSVSVTGDGLDGESAGESEAGVALVGSGAPEANVGGGDSETVVDLRDRAAVNLTKDRRSNEGMCLWYRCYFRH